MPIGPLHGILPIFCYETNLLVWNPVDRRSERFTFTIAPHLLHLISMYPVVGDTLSKSRLPHLGHFLPTLIIFSSGIFNLPVNIHCFPFMEHTFYFNSIITLTSRLSSVLAYFLFSSLTYRKACSDAVISCKSYYVIIVSDKRNIYGRAISAFYWNTLSFIVSQT